MGAWNNMTSWCWHVTAIRRWHCSRHRTPQSIETSEEALLIRNLQLRFSQQDYQVLSLMRDIAMSPGFRYTALPALEGEMP